jgi:hypothetical protein
VEHRLFEYFFAIKSKERRLIMGLESRWHQQTIETRNWLTVLIAASITFLTLLGAMHYIHEQYRAGYKVGTAEALKGNQLDVDAIR